MRIPSPPLPALACLVAAASLGVAQGPVYEPAVHFDAGSSPIGFVVGNFDGDPQGRPDVLALDPTSLRLLINGVPGAPDLFTEAAQPWINNLNAAYSVVVSLDQNGDSCLDAVALDGSLLLSFLSACSGCTLGCPVPPAVPPADHLVAAELDNDGVLYVLGSSAVTGTVFVLQSDGMGCFLPAVEFPAGASPRGLAIDDLDQDGDEDVAVALQGLPGVAILENQGGASFGPPMTFQAPPAFVPEDVAVGDLDGDGVLDLVLCGMDGPSAEVLVFQGTGGAGAAISFGSPAAFPVAGLDPVAILVEDLDLDGDLDVATANRGSDSLTVLQGDGAGALGAALVLPVGDGPVDLVSDDFDQDGLPDLASVNNGASSISVLPLAAPTCSDNLSFEGGQLGGTVTFELSGTPGEFYLLVPSLQPGPTPLDPYFTGTSLSMTVGLDLFNLDLGRLGLFTGPPALVSYALPNVSTLHGKALYAQFLRFTPSGEFSGLSCRVSVPLIQPQSAAFTLGEVGTARQGQTVTRLPNGDVLVAGGDIPDGLGGMIQANDTLEVFEFKTQQFLTLPARMTIPRSTHTATLLQDGRVLFLGGYPDPVGGIATSSGEIFDPATGTTTPIAPMNNPRTQHTATLLSDGRVFVCGGLGVFDLNSIMGSLMTGKMDSETYDPVTDTWTPGPDLPANLLGHQASLLPNGQVLITAGVELTDIFGVPLPLFTNLCHRYDPVTNGFVAGTAPLPVTTGFVFHAQATLSNGQVAVAGGANGDFVALIFNTLGDTYLYDPAANSWTQGSPIQFPRAYGQLLETTDNHVILTGGLADVDIFTGSGTPEQRIEETALALSSWTHQASMSTIKGREVLRVAFVGPGLTPCILIVGVGDKFTVPVEMTAEIYCP